MSLIPVGDEVLTGDGANRLGHDLNKNYVAVVANHEAVNDFGWLTVWQVAEAKYARDEYEISGAIRLVRISTADCISIKTTPTVHREISAQLRPGD